MDAIGAEGGGTSMTAPVPPSNRPPSGREPSSRKILVAAIVWAVVVHAVALTVVLRRHAPFVVNGAWSPRLVSWETKAPLARWDSYWYWTIAENGYEWKDDGKMHDVAFFPLVPVLMASMTRATGLHPFLAGEILSFLALVGALLALARLALEDGYSPGATLRALLLFPTAFFFVSVYSESLFLLTSVAFLLFLRRRQFALAAVAGMLAALTRSSGFLLVVPAAVETFRAAPDEKRKFAAAALGPTAGVAAFAAWQWHRFGTPFAYVLAERGGWNRRLTWPWLTLERAIRWRPHMVTELALILAFGLLTLPLLRRLPAEASFALASVAFILASGSLQSVPRYVLTIFPVFFVIGEFLRRRPVLDRIYAGVGFAGLVFLTIRFVSFRWVA